MIANGWKASQSEVNNYDNNANAETYFSPDFLNPEAAADATIADIGAGVSRHVAMLFTNNKVLLGFEDLNRANGSSDEDFNDAVFVVTADPHSAISSSKIAVAAATVAPAEPSLVACSARSSC